VSEAETVAYELLIEKTRRLKEVWPTRMEDPDATQEAIDEVNEAGMELNRVREEEGE
jgi:hypothetical protein